MVPASEKTCSDAPAQYAEGAGAATQRTGRASQLSARSGGGRRSVEVEKVDLGESADLALALFRGLGGVRQNKSGLDPSTGSLLLCVDRMPTQPCCQLIS